MAGSRKTLRPRVRDTHVRDMREVGRRREFKDELPARRIPAFELLERIADVAAEDDRTFGGLHDDDLMSGGVPRRRQEPDARQSFRLAGWSAGENLFATVQAIPPIALLDHDRSD